MATIFLDSEHMLLIDYLPAKTTMNGQYYADLLLKLHHAVKQKQHRMQK